MPLAVKHESHTARVAQAGSALDLSPAGRVDAGRTEHWTRLAHLCHSVQVESSRTVRASAVRIEGLQESPAGAALGSSGSETSGTGSVALAVVDFEGAEGQEGGSEALRSHLDDDVALAIGELVVEEEDSILVGGSEEVRLAGEGRLSSSDGDSVAEQEVAKVVGGDYVDQQGQGLLIVGVATEEDGVEFEFEVGVAGGNSELLRH